MGFLDWFIARYGKKKSVHVKPHRNECSEEKYKFAKSMRNNPTESEAILWQAIRKRKLGYKFHRQALMYGWIIDFYCPAKMLLIEIDGEYHNKRRQRIADWYRDKKLKARGFKTIRFKNDEVLNHLLDVIKRIKWELR